MAKAIKLKNNVYLDSSSISHNKETLQQILNKRVIVYMMDGLGLLIKLPNASLYKMMMIKIIGNGYGASPVDVIIQGYHYDRIGNFINCKQHNNSGSLAACKFLIMDGVICLWIPSPGIYSSLIVEVYASIPTYSQLVISGTLLYSEPVGSSNCLCSLV